jgi:hypothetical protein
MRPIPEKKIPTYRKSIFLNVNGREILQAVYDRPKALQRALQMVRLNKARVYTTDDSNNP